MRSQAYGVLKPLSHLTLSQLQMFKYSYLLFLVFSLYHDVISPIFYLPCSPPSCLQFFFSQLGYSLNFYWFNFFFVISSPITWVVTRQTYEAFQPSMHVNNIQVGRQRFLVILQSFHHVFYLLSFFFQLIIAMLQPLQYNLIISKLFYNMHKVRSSILFKFEIMDLTRFQLCFDGV